MNSNKTTLTGMAFTVSRWVWMAHESGAELTNVTIRFGDEWKFELTVAGDGITIEVKHGWDDGEEWRVITRVLTFPWNASDKVIFLGLRRRLDSMNNHAQW